ncbi:hypothetical protein BH09PSE5_BH09PSE5_36370 [soil metagenome]
MAIWFPGYQTQSMRAALSFAMVIGSLIDSSIAAAQSIDAVRGQRLVAQYQCGSCHKIPGVPAAQGVAAPSLEAFGKRSYIAGHLPNRADTLARWIADPKQLVADTTMPSMGASAQDARDMAAFLMTLR